MGSRNIQTTITMTDIEKENLRLKQLWTKRKTDKPFSVFQEWHLSADKKCFYCGITEQEIKLLIDNNWLTTKRLKTRGRKLELDRKQSELPYSNLENLVLSCYWCNNAKTDTFTHEEFLEVGRIIGDIWKKRMTN